MTAHPKPPVVNDPEHLAFIRTLPCWFAGQYGHICGETIGKGKSEASHLDGKSRDDRTLPMCGRLHRTGPKAWHAGQQSFCAFYGVTKEELIHHADQLYRERHP